MKKMRMSVLCLVLVALTAHPARLVASADEAASGSGSCDAGKDSLKQHGCTDDGGGDSRTFDGNASPLPVTAAHEYCIIGAGYVDSDACGSSGVRKSGV